MKGCIATGPITATFGVCASLFTYKGGIYKCDCNESYSGTHTINIVGYGQDPVCHWQIRNSWGDKWGESGFMKMECGSCGIEGKWEDGNIVFEKVG